MKRKIVFNDKPLYEWMEQTEQELLARLKEETAPEPACVQSPSPVVQPDDIPASNALPEDEALSQAA